ncbi:MAG: hypothetical protein C0594_17280 [Marinilabiliales bacterium]|nr:MAG: hypothetical protein C0594_17280 [Marinilabiliales bacterium]
MKIRLFIFSILFVFSVSAIAQYSKNDKYRFIDAEYDFLYEEYDNALSKYLNLYKKDTSNNNIAYRIGLCYSYLYEYRKSIPYFEKATKNVSRDYKDGSFKETRAPLDTYLRLANAYRQIFKTEKAMFILKNYLELIEPDNVYGHETANHEIDKCYTALELTKYPLTININHLPNPINNENHNWHIAVSADGKHMVYTTKTDQEDIYYVQMLSDSTWSVPDNITYKISSSGFFYPVYISAKGNKMILSDGDLEKGDLYYAIKENGNWQKMEPFGRKINSKYCEQSACLSPDENTMILSIKNKESLGGFDLFYTKKENNEWSDVQNIGTAINSIYDEIYPSLINDSTLIFCSKGHNNMGGFDIFRSKKTENGWSSPVNLGFPISTPSDDIYYSFINDSLIYKSMLDTSSLGGFDIYCLNILNTQKAIKEQNDSFISAITSGDTSIIASISNSNTDSIENLIPVIEVKGTISFDDQSQNENPVKITIMHKNAILAELVSDVNREYSFNTIPGDFTLIFHAAGYETSTEEISIPNSFHSKIFNHPVTLKSKQITTGNYIAINNIYFDYGSFQLSKDEKVKLAKLSSLIETNPSLLIEVIGYTDAKGNIKFNKELSIKRARTVIEYLVQNGIDKKHFVAKGMGEANQIAINKNPDGSDNPEGRKYNRRVELKIHNAQNTVIVEDTHIPEHLRYNAGEIQYTVFITNSNQQIQSDEFSNLTEHKTKNSYIYTAGKFNKKEEAISFLNTKYVESFPDASIISLKQLDKIISEANTVKNDAYASGGDKDTYRIQVKALMKSVGTSYFNNLSNVEELHCYDGLFRYVTGYYKTKEQALIELQRIINKGYPDAFLVRSKRLEILTGNKPKEANIDSIATTAAFNPNENFVIQILSVKKNVDLNKFKGLQKTQIHIYKGADGYFRYTWGPFNSFNEARQEWRQLIKQDQYNDAFIMNSTFYEKFENVNP